VTETQERLIDLLEYIEQVEKLKKTAPFKVPNDYFRAFRSDLQGLPGVEFNLVNGGDDVWTRISRLTEDAPPDPPESLRAWVSIPKTPEKMPELRSEISVKKDNQEKRFTLDQFPGVRKILDKYVAEHWTPWAAKERIRRKTIALYNKLFAIQQTIEADGGEAALETVWGMGFAVWKKEGAPGTIEYPLLSQICEISLDTKTFALEIRPRDADPILELDCYVDSGVEGVSRTQAFWRTYRETASSRPTPFELDTTEPILKAAVGFLDPAGQFIDPTTHDGQMPPAMGRLQVTDSWVLFVRKRSGHLFLQDIERLKKNLKDDDELPSALAAFVTEGADSVAAREKIEYRGLSSSGTGAGVRELYFPMPYNSEQVSIVEKLEISDGVVVQGPPGTGKTHTIANVICHFLAHGRRVLVTSKGEEALRVLQEKIPEEIRALSVALLTDEHTGMKQFEHSIQTIASNVSDMQPRKVEAEIAGHEARLGELHQKIAALDHSITELAERQLARIKFEDRDISPEELARFVVEKAEEYGWFTDALDPKTQTQPGFTNEDISALRESRRRVGDDLKYLTSRLPSADSLLTPDAIVTLHLDLQRSRGIDAAVLAGAVLPLANTTAKTFEKAKALAEHFKKGSAMFTQIRARQRPWTGTIRSMYRSPSGELPKQLLGTCSQILKTESGRRARLTTPVSAPEDAEVDAELLEAIERLCTGKNAFALPFGKKEARAKLAQITVSGLAPKSDDDWAKVKAELEHRIGARKLVAAWNAMAPEFRLEQVRDSDVTGFRELVEMTEHIVLVYRMVTDIDRPATALVEEVFGIAVWKSLPDDHDVAREELASSLRKHLDRGRLSYAVDQVGEACQKLDGASGPVVDGIRMFLSDQLGSASVSDHDIAHRWREHLAELRRLAALRTDLVTIERVTCSIANSGAELWAKSLRSNPATADIDTLLPAAWLEAWRWRAAKGLVESLEGHQELKSQFDRRKAAEGDLAKTYRDLVAAKAWLAVHEKSPDNVRQALQEYLNEIQAIGKGTGIRAIHHRLLARAAMERAYPAVPCWIMPQWRVSESIPAKIGSFDLVVIDEASQSDIWAMPALLRGRKVLVVGDHRQVSPSGVGLEEARIVDLFSRFLTNQPHGSQMRPDRSIYDLARVVFAGNSVMLKEHFRCVPAIIEYSKRQFYEHQIKPLRIPKRSERLDPPLIDVFVKGGYRKGDINEPEARAIVAEIESIIADPATAGRSIGVVTLLGNEQAKRIDDLVRRKILTHEIVARKIRVGEPPVFQGRESDIMLLSMVLQKGDRGLTDQVLHQQRMNVAASRARDRMILFRSIQESDVNPSTLTAHLMAHFRHPFHQDAQKLGALRDLCESDFERDMFDEITSRGYRIRPQVKVGGYRLDFVIEGAEDRRLAVECDGDRYHGPGQWADDMIRQRILERAGWIFWRCFASSFVLRRKQVLDDLLATLKKLGIDPLGSEAIDASAWVSSRVIDPLAVEAGYVEDVEPPTGALRVGGRSQPRSI
jgi:very-short-patch-repair endonuclease